MTASPPWRPPRLYPILRHFSRVCVMMLRQTPKGYTQEGEKNPKKSVVAHPRAVEDAAQRLGGSGEQVGSGDASRRPAAQQVRLEGGEAAVVAGVGDHLRPAALALA